MVISRGFPPVVHVDLGQILRLHLPRRAADPHHCGTERLRQGREAAVQRGDVSVDNVIVIISSWHVYIYMMCVICVCMYVNSNLLNYIYIHT